MATGAVTPAVGAAAAAAPGFGSSSLYVGDLEQNVNESQLYDIFSQVAQVVSVRVCRDLNKRSSLGYAYVNYGNPQDAATAKEILNFTPINGKPIRIMYSHRDPSIRKSGHANVFVKHLHPNIDNKALHDTFSVFGNVLSCKLAVDNHGHSKGYGFIQYETEESAQNAINKLDKMLLDGKQVDVCLFIRRQERNQKFGFTNVYVNNLSETTTKDHLEDIFKTFGKITSSVVMEDGHGKSRCFGFVNFADPEHAAAAVEKMNGTTHDDKVWYVGRAQKKSEREAELRAKFEQERLSRYEKLKLANLYVKNLDDSIDDAKLEAMFTDFGEVKSCKVMLDSNGMSKGSGFVAFSTPEEATTALNAMNGKMIGQKPLYVAVAQRKDERVARLQAHFAQVRAPGGGISPLPSGISAYHPGAPSLGPQQIYYGQGTPGLIPPQPAGYGFQQQLFPGMRPGGPNFIAPYHPQRQGQPGQRMGVRRSGNSHQQMQQPQFLRNPNQGMRYMGNARNGVDPSVIPLMPGMSLAPIEAQRPGPVPISTLTTALASASPEDRNRMLGEQLFPLVLSLEPVQTAKVTGMLLEMDQTEVLHLIESPEALKTKVREAMAVLQEAGARPELSTE